MHANCRIFVFLSIIFCLSSVYFLPHKRFLTFLDNLVHKKGLGKCLLHVNEIQRQDMLRVVEMADKAEDLESEILCQTWQNAHPCSTD
jgi:hypothetical protein